MIDHEDFVGFCFMVMVVLIMTTGVVMLVMCLTASGKADYCYMEHRAYVQPDTIALKGHRPWREDREIDTFPTIEAAASAAAKIGCEIK